MSFDAATLRTDLTTHGGVDYDIDFPIYASVNVGVFVNFIEQVQGVHYVVRIPGGGAPFETLSDASLPSLATIRFLFAPPIGLPFSAIPLQDIEQRSRYSTEPLPTRRIERDFDNSWFGIRAIWERLQRTPSFDKPSLLKNILIDELVEGKVLGIVAGPRIACVEPALKGDPGEDGADSIVPGPAGAGASPTIADEDGLAVVSVPTAIRFNTDDGFIITVPAAGVALISMPFGTIGAALRAIVDAEDARTLLSVPLVSEVPALAGDNIYTGRQQFKQGANITAASSLVLTADGNYFHVTGDTTITEFSVLQAGTEIVLVFDGAPLLINSATLILRAGADFQTRSGDTLTFRSEGAAWREISPLLSLGVGSVSVVDAVGVDNAITNTAVETTFFVTTIPGNTIGTRGRLRFHALFTNTEKGLDGTLISRNFTLRLKLNGSTVWTKTIGTRREDAVDLGHVTIGGINSLDIIINAKGSHTAQLILPNLLATDVTAVGATSNTFNTGAVIDTTVNFNANVILTLTGQYDSANPSASTRMKHAILEAYKAG